MDADRLDLPEPPGVRLCTTCDRPLLPDRQWRCLACQFAAERAVQVAELRPYGERTVRASDVERERLLNP